MIDLYNIQINLPKRELSLIYIPSSYTNKQSLYSWFKNINLYDILFFSENNLSIYCNFYFSITVWNIEIKTEIQNGSFFNQPFFLLKCDRNKNKYLLITAITAASGPFWIIWLKPLMDLEINDCCHCHCQY